MPLAAVFFNDAGAGKDNAVIAALEILQARGIAAGAVSHVSGRIGDASDMWQHSVISHVNDAAERLSFAVGWSVRVAAKPTNSFVLSW